MLLILFICVADTGLPCYTNFYLSVSQLLDQIGKPRPVHTVNLLRVAEDTASVHQWQGYIHRPVYSRQLQRSDSELTSRQQAGNTFALGRVVQECWTM